MSISSSGYQKMIRPLTLLLVLSVGLLGPSSQPVVAQPGTVRADALVLVNSASASYADFQHYVQPYLDHFGIPYTLLDIATAPVEPDLDVYAVIIVGHRQIDIAGTYLDATEQAYISTAVDNGTGLVNFDNDLSADGATGRYQFVQDIFDFGYVAPSSQAGVTFLSDSGSYVRINCWEDAHQEPILPTTSNVGDLVPDDNQWTEFLWTSRGYPALFAGYDETPPLMRFYGAVPDGEYQLIAHLYWSHNLRYYWGYTAADPEVYSYDVTSGVSGDFADYELGTVTVTGGQFDLYVQNADPLTGGVEYLFYGWAWIRLVPTGAPPAEMHYITERHEAGETISTASMTMAGITLPATATSLATSGTQPFLSVTASGLGRAVQWGSYDWMSHAVKGPVYGLDDLVWRSIVWAARKPFVMQGLPPFVTMRMDDESGPFWWIHIANEFDIKPWAGLFYHNVDATEAADLSALVHAGQATASVHAKNGAFFYYNHGSGDFSDGIIADNFAEATAWHTQYDIPISKFVLPHYYEFGTNVFQGLDDWGVEFVGTMMNPGNGYGAPWVMNGPYRLYETGSSSGGSPVYYADFMTIPGHPEFDGHFFNCVTEIRDDAGYEWYPSNDVPGSIGRGTRQTVRALDSMALATLFTHGYYPASITPDNWRAILQGITDNLAAYNPQYVTMDHACQYVRAMHTSAISGSVYNPVSRELTTTLSGSTDLPTMFYLFVDQADSIVSILVDVPIFTGTTDVVYTLAGPLDSIVVTPALATVVTGGTQQFTATGYDAGGNPIPNLPITWDVVNGGGTITSSGLFTAGSTPGTYPATIRAAYGGIEGYATVEVLAPALDHFTFDPISNPQYIDVPFAITIQARDLSGNLLTGYIGQATLSDTAGTLFPTQTGSFSGGVWSGEVTITQTASGVTITAADGSASGVSNAFNVQSVPTYYTLSSASYQHYINTPFDVTVEAYAGAEIDLWADEHQEPVLDTFTDPARLNDHDGLWDEFWYQAGGRPFPGVFAGHNEWEDYGLAPMHFFATNIPDGEYAVWANLYTGGSAATTYYYGFTESEALSSARSVTNVLGAGGSDQFDEYLLGAVQVSNNHFDLWAGDGDSTSPYFYAWASVRLVPVDNEIFVDCSDDAHQDPILATTSIVGDLSATDGHWTEFLYLPSRPYPSILAGVNEENYGLPTMRFYTTGIANGTYEVIANLYDNSPMRYYYGYTEADPKASYVDVAGGASGTQHREYSLGIVTVTDGTFNLYVRDGDLLGGTYPFFGWAWVRLVDHYVQMTSSSATMSFDGNANGVFGEPGDEVASLVGGTVIIAAVDETAANNVTVTATDALGRWGTSSYDIIYPTAVILTRFEARPGAGQIVLAWETGTEIDNLGFNLYRSEHASGLYTQLNDTLIPSQAPGLPTGATYEWTDATIAAGIPYYYQIEAVDMRGGLAHLGPVSATWRIFRLYLPVVTR
ncbi:MAG: hypothetical protein JXA93_02725 [Anaerolineae bacterium]|nr:hypothetical protein [Anaerolineae bacterium]